MTLRRLPRPLALAAGVAVVLAGVAQAQSPPPAPAAPYQDRVIAPDRLQALPPDEDETEAGGSDEGLPRSLRAEFSLSGSERGDEIFAEQGLALGGFWETSTLGGFSLNASVFRSDRDRFASGSRWGGTATLWQRNLYLDGDWRGDNGLGVLNTPSLPLQRSQYRFYLPSVPFAGASSQWSNARTGLQLQAALGQAGNYTGTRAIGFDAAGGTVGALGAQWNWGPGWTGAAAFLGTQGRIVPDSRGEAVLEPGNTQALHVASAWRGIRDALQLNLLASAGDRDPATGVWIDASARRGRYNHQYGAYRFAPDLAWGALPINNDVEGGYYRLGYQYGRWNWSGGLDGLHSISGRGADALYATGYARYQATSTLGYGGSLNVRRSPQLAHSAQLFADKRTRWGQTRAQLDQARAAGAGGDSWQASVNHAFPLQQGARLSTSIGHGALAREGGTSTTTTLAFYGGRDLTDRLSIDGSTRWTRGDGPNALRGLDLNLGVSWRLHPRWSLSATVYQNQGSQRSPFILDPLATQTPFISLPRDRSLFLALRYDWNAGRPQAVIGGAPGAPVGRVSGSVYLDDNDDGSRAASEQPAANVTVLLDGRYSVRTDSLGRFEFPRVAVGAHTVTVVPDNLPLPWVIDDAGRPVEVTVRTTVRLDIGARRPR